MTLNTACLFCSPQNLLYMKHTLPETYFITLLPVITHLPSHSQDTSRRHLYGQRSWTMCFYSPQAHFSPCTYHTEWQLPSYLLFYIRLDFSEYRGNILYLFALNKHLRQGRTQSRCSINLCQMK